MDHNPCWAWKRAMAVACQKGSLDTQALKDAELHAVKSGCTQADVVASKECRTLFEKAGAFSECPRLFAVNGYVPYYEYQNCRYTKLFNTPK